jgi:hypothetical protein
MTRKISGVVGLPKRSPTRYASQNATIRCVTAPENAQWEYRSVNLNSIASPLCCLSCINHMCFRMNAESGDCFTLLEQYLCGQRWGQQKNCVVKHTK